MLDFRPILLFLCLDVAIGITITSTSTPDQFPIQFPNSENPRTFFRTTTGTELELIWCPEGYLFDAKQLFCVKRLRSIDNRSYCVGNELIEELQPNPDNCQTFYNCNKRCCYLHSCASYLIFNNKTKRCDYPGNVECCEYKEKNPNLLIQF